MTVFEKALTFAAKKHEGQLRKRNGIPYILHPCEAAAIASTITDDPEILAAVMLHDILEDTNTAPEEIEREFGERIAHLVMEETENAHDSLSPEESWYTRKKESLAHLHQTTDKAVRIMWLSDKLSNIRSFFRLHLEEGDEMWKHFHQKDKKLQEWYYREVVSEMDELSETLAYREYVWLVDIIFGGKHENGTKG
ncbi:HD domain-containing protein [Ruminococcus sp.]|uniref:HD domain-containing protein n=1 Tax=Ruminococcus sp. TaxID=41978 RepID=UPI0038903A5D